jgi:6-phosphogluconate dehydrogenase
VETWRDVWLRAGINALCSTETGKTVNALAKEGLAPACSLEELVEKLSAPRAIWIMLPSGAPTEETVAALSKRLESGDAISFFSSYINSYFRWPRS